VIITAGEGRGKTTFCRQFAIMCASGMHPFRRYDIPALRVLYVDLENSRRQSERAFFPLRARAGDRYQRGQLILVPRPAGMDLRDIADRRWLDAVMRRRHPDLLVIGPLYKAFRTRPGERKVDEDAAEQAAAALDELRVRHRCALLIEAHSPHGDTGDRANWRPYGASLWMRWPEFGLGLAPSPNEGCFDVKNWRGARDRSRQWPERLIEGTAWPWEDPDLRAEHFHDLEHIGGA
jgi:replicative DNA helicase